VTTAAVLFDLDGTLVDTAPDLVGVLNRMLAECDRPPVPYAIARNEVSNGAIRLLRLGFGTDHDDNEFERLRARFVELYRRDICANSRLFINIHEFLNRIDNLITVWGIVTNKPQALTEPLLAELGIAELAACVVSGDRLAERKPHPAPLQLAAEELGRDPRHCVYVGDSPHDIEAGRAAGMRTVAAAYGYIRPTDDPRKWGATAVIQHPSQLAGALAAIEGITP